LVRNQYSNKRRIMYTLHIMSFVQEWSIIVINIQAWDARSNRWRTHLHATWIIHACLHSPKLNQSQCINSRSFSTKAEWREAIVAQYIFAGWSRICLPQHMQRQWLAPKRSISNEAPWPMRSISDEALDQKDQFLTKPLTKKINFWRSPRPGQFVMKPLTEEVNFWWNPWPKRSISDKALDQRGQFLMKVEWLTKSISDEGARLVKSISDEGP
jgi:hypothetical protein